MTVFYRLLDRVTDGLALIAGLYLAWIFLAIVFQVIARSVFMFGSSHIFTFIEIIRIQRGISRDRMSISSRT